MQLENSFELEVAPEEAWNVLLDVPRIVPCIPGAELVEVRGETEWLVRVKVKLGSMGMDFLNEVKLAERDDAAHMIRLDLKGRDVSGRGMVMATVSSTVREVDQRTMVSMTTNLQIAGKMAQFGRGIVADVSASLVDSFAGSLRAELAATGVPPDAIGQAPAQAPQAPQAPALSVFALVLSVVRRRLRHIFGRRPSTHL